MNNEKKKGGNLNFELPLEELIMRINFLFECSLKIEKLEFDKLRAVGRIILQYINNRIIIKS